MTRAADGLFSLRVMQTLLGQLQVEPSNAAAAGPITSPATNWGFGVLGTLIAAGAVTNPFYLAGITAYDNIAAQTGLHQVRLYYGGADTLLADWRFYLDPANGILFDRAEMFMGLPAGEPIPASSRVRAAVAYFNGAGAGASGVLFDLYFKQVTG